MVRAVQMIAPLLDEMADEYDDRLAVVKVDIDKNQQTAMRFNVRSIPTLILMKNGDLVLKNSVRCLSRS